MSTEKKRFLYDQEREWVNRNTIEQFTDRELLEKQTYYLSQVYNNTSKVRDNVQFFFYLTVVSMALGLLILILSTI